MRRFAALLALAVLALAAPSLPPATAEDDGDETRVLVRFRDGTDEKARKDELKAHKAKKAGEVYGDDVWVAESEGGEKADKLAAKLAKSRKVEYAEIDEKLQVVVGEPDDPRFGEQYALRRIDAVAGWTAYPGTYSAPAGPTIAIVDTGIASSHPELSDRITPTSRCFGLLCVLTGFEDDNGHGTHVAGTAAAATNNGTGVAGVAFNARIMALKVCNAIGTCSTSDVASAINWAAQNGADVVSMSLGGGGTTTMQNAVRSAWAAGVVLVAAAGNDGNSTLSYPAAYAEVISVAATDANDARASFSNANADVELAAPGVGVLSTYTGGGYRSLSGTSMSTPHVAGLAALLVGQNPGWTNQQVRDRMASCADDLGAPGRDPQFGFGRIDLGRALGSC